MIKLKIVLLMTFFITIIFLSYYIYKYLFFQRVVKKRFLRYWKYIDHRVVNPVNKKSGFKLSFGEFRLVRKANIYFRFEKWLDARLDDADISLKSNEYLVLHILVTLILVFSVYIFGNKLLFTIFPCVLGVVSFFCIPRYLKKRKQKKIRVQLPGVLPVLSNALRAGYSLAMAINNIVVEAEKPIAAEFEQLQREIQLGSTLEAALNNMVQRLEVGELEMMATAIIIQREVGGNLAEILDNITENIRERVYLQQEIKTLTAQGRVSGYIVSLLPLALFLLLYFINPEYTKTLFVHPLGIFFIIAALAGELIGILCIRKIVNIDI